MERVFLDEINKLQVDIVQEVTENLKMVERDYKQNCIDWLLKKQPKKLYIILGEASQSHAEYIYNPANNRQNFLRKEMVRRLLGKDIHEVDGNGYFELLAEKGIVIIDLMPLPLKTEFYKEKIYLPNEEVLKEYWRIRISALRELIEEADHVSLCVRYKKIAPIASKFLNFLNNEMPTLKATLYASCLNYLRTDEYFLSTFTVGRGIPRNLQREVNEEKLRAFLDL